MCIRDRVKLVAINRFHISRRIKKLKPFTSVGLVIFANNLKKGHTKSCGCHKHQQWDGTSNTALVAESSYAGTTGRKWPIWAGGNVDDETTLMKVGDIATNK